MCAYKINHKLPRISLHNPFFKKSRQETDKIIGRNCKEIRLSKHINVDQYLCEWSVYVITDVVTVLCNRWHRVLIDWEIMGGYYF